MELLNKIRFSAVVTTCVFMFISCNKSDVQSEQKLIENNVAIQSEQNVLYFGDSKYSKILDQYPIVGFSSLRENSLANDQLTFRNEVITTKSANVSIKINGRDIHDYQTETKSNSHFEDLYGKSVSFKVSFANTKSEMIDNEVKMYIPNLVKITSPKIQTVEELYPYCYYRDFLLKWNKDELNENGLVVMVEWYGATLNGIESKSVRNIDIISADDGSEVLSNKLFENIPDKAICYIVLLRGNIENIENSTINYSLLGETHSVLPIILVTQSY